jgi:hypothetical protein
LQSVFQVVAVHHPIITEIRLESLKHFGSDRKAGLETTGALKRDRSLKSQN